MTYNLGQLWTMARQYGKVTLFTNDDGTYHARIAFLTLEHTSLEAKSDFKRPTPEAALEMAIYSAEKIVAGIKTLPASEMKLLK